MKYLLILSLFLCSLSASALEVPALTAPVMDKAQVLSAEHKNNLEQKIRHIWEQEKQVQISILIIPSLEGEVLEDYSIKVAEKWQLGTKKDDNGLLILIAMQERKIRIEVGNGIEGIVTDSRAGRMIERMKSYMRNGDIHGALLLTVSSIQELMQANTPEAIAKREQEALDKAEQDKIAAAEREQTMKQLAEYSVWLLIAVLLLNATYNFFDTYVTLPKEIKSLGDDKEQLKRKMANENANLSEQSNKLQGLKVDRFKYSYIKNQQVYQNLVARKSQLIASINTMKKYLGVK